MDFLSKKTARLWEAESGKLLATFQGHDVVYSAVFSPAGRRVLTASRDGSGANFIKCMYLSGERLCRFKRPGPRPKFPERWLIVRLLVV